MNTMAVRLNGWTDRGLQDGLPVLTRGQVLAVQGNNFIRMQLNYGHDPQVTIKTTSGVAAWRMLDILAKDLINRGGSVQMKQSMWKAANPDFDNGII